MDQLEEWHRAESSGDRNQQLEQEQDEQEQDTDNDNDKDSSDDFFDNSDLPKNVTEPAIEITTDFQEIEGNDEISLSLLNPTFSALNEIAGNDESFPVSAEYADFADPLDLINL